MQLLVTASIMQRYDRLAIRRYGISGVALMENAGRAFADRLDAAVGSVSKKHVVIVCGKGNNGGDGFVIARHLANRGARVSVVALARLREMKGDAKTNLGILLKLAAKDDAVVFKLMSKTGPFPRLAPPDIIVDAIFGTGFAGAARGSAERAIRWMNSRRCFLASVDIPSGVDADTGTVQGIAVSANLTVTMGLAKIGHYIGAGREHSGKVTVADISIPHFLFSPGPRQVYRVLPQDVGPALPRRPLTAHKHSVGKVFILAGSKNLTGAPTMTAQAAMRVGAGAVVLGTPKSIHKILVRKVTEVMVSPLPETSAGSLSLEGTDEILKRCEWADVVVIGPGLSTHPETTELVLSLVPRIPRPLVLDADGLNAVATRRSVLAKRRFPTILTPHVGELSRIMRHDAGHIETLRVEYAPKAAGALHSIVVLKGSPTITATPSGTTYMNSTGNPGMATAGAGDVLTGLIAGLVGQGMSAPVAAYSGVLIHGLAGDLAAKSYGERSMMALDIFDRIPDTLRMVEA
jgi:hydroxyethylthiazole kinase-like uncharacterized protein yjeF